MPIEEDRHCDLCGIKSGDTRPGELWYFIELFFNHRRDHCSGCHPEMCSRIIACCGKTREEFIAEYERDTVDPTLVSPPHPMYDPSIIDKVHRRIADLTSYNLDQE